MVSAQTSNRSGSGSFLSWLMEDSDERIAARRRRVDRISSLTDDLLIHILSFLPTKFAAGTSVLSTRWKNLADKIVNIDLDDSLFLRRRPWVPPEKRSPSIKANFAFFVRKVLFSRVGSTIQSFHLCYRNRYDYHLFDKWILFVLMHNVREMHLDVKIDTSKSYPVEIFTSKTLEVLRLVAGFDLSLPIANFNLVNLKVLRLEFINFNDDESLERVLSGCPVLQELRLHLCQMLGVNTLIKVCIPSLKNLSLLHCFGEYHVILDTPNLENLLYDTRGDLGFSIKNRTSIVNAEIAWGLIDEEHMEEIKKKEDLLSYGGRGMKVINSMNNVRSLCLQGSSLTALYYSESSLATFRNLTRLELSPSSLLRDWWALPDLLACCPNLEALLFFEGFIIPRDIGKEFGYCLPQSVPVCFTSSLKVIEIRDFYGQECELKIVEYFLAHVAFLRKMVIGTDVCGVSPFGSKRDGGLMYHQEIPEWVLPTCKRLSETPRCLKTCQIVVSWTERLKKSMRILI